MIKLIVGKKGTGKTKQLIYMMNDSVAKVNGNIVCIEEGMESTFNVNSNIRLIDIDEYKIDSYDRFYGFFAGVLAGNYDIEQVYIDGLMRIGAKDLDEIGKLLELIDGVSGDKKVVVTISADEESLPDSIKKYL